MRILHLQHSDGDSVGLRRELQQQGLHAELTPAASADELVESLGAGAFDAVVINDALLHRTSVSQVQRVQDRVGRQHAAVSRLISVVQELSLARDLQQIVEIVRRAARQLTGADGADFVIRDDDRAHYIAESAITPLWKGRRVPLIDSVSGWAITGRRPIVIADIRRESRAPVERYRSTFVRSLVAVPIRSADPLGAIGVYWSQPHQCTPDELMLLEALANTTAVSMENVRVYADLERLVEERTRELKAANEELEAFNLAVSHDLRAPLRAMSAAVESLDDIERTPLLTQKRLLRDHVLTMNRLVNDLLRLSRVGRTELHIEPCDLAALAQEVVQRLRLSHPDRRVTWRISRPMSVQADAGLMSIALDNLLSNAWKYTAQRDEAEVSFTWTPDARRQNVFCVSDNGAGFDPQYAHRLFKPFERLHSEIEFAGTGLGLATVQRIIARHDGALWAESAPNAGARFYFTLGDHAKDGAT